MTLHFIDRLPMIGTADIDGLTLTYAWVWHQPCLRITFNGPDNTLLGHVTHLDGLPRLAAAPTGMPWLNQAAPARAAAVLDHAIDIWRRKEDMFRTCNG
ncbi:hypothetical protein [Glycomyces niveus]|uniref:Uncharacterized protein n=1 Tax=Glycomyces niveus TaxID=2820287 RepID=A0ABS3U9L8_9ACTN|nr:hypothetical protein [Glycomyces sp. NEAU-S30]MBO3735474.1 hypothetical protein [Glycomyces sp. NEAU-S30]